MSPVIVLLYSVDCDALHPFLCDSRQRCSFLREAISIAGEFTDQICLHGNLDNLLCQIFHCCKNLIKPKVSSFSMFTHHLCRVCKDFRTCSHLFGSGIPSSAFARSSLTWTLISAITIKKSCYTGTVMCLRILTVSSATYDPVFGDQ